MWSYKSGSVGIATQVHLETAAMVDKLWQSWVPVREMTRGCHSSMLSMAMAKEMIRGCQSSVLRRVATSQRAKQMEPEAARTFNFTLDLSVPGHFPSQSAARRYLHNLMRLG